MIRADLITKRPVVDAFERAVADYVGVKYAVAFSSGTAALHGAYFAAGIGHGDEIVTSPLTLPLLPTPPSISGAGRSLQI